MIPTGRNNGLRKRHRENDINNIVRFKRAEFVSMAFSRDYSEDQRDVDVDVKTIIAE